MQNVCNLLFNSLLLVCAVLLLTFSTPFGTIGNSEVHAAPFPEPRIRHNRHHKYFWTPNINPCPSGMIQGHDKICYREVHNIISRRRRSIIRVDNTLSNTKWNHP